MSVLYNALYEEIDRLRAVNAQLRESCFEVICYLRELDNVKNMKGPEYGIWHRLMERTAKAEREG